MSTPVPQKELGIPEGQELRVGEELMAQRTSKEIGVSKPNSFPGGWKND